jgi:hypothetical protein
MTQKGFTSTEVVQVNLLSVMHGTKLAMERLSNGGLVINVASVAGLVPAPPIPAYSASKAAIINYTRYFLVAVVLWTWVSFKPFNWILCANRLQTPLCKSNS